MVDLNKNKEELVTQNGEDRQTKRERIASLMKERREIQKNNRAIIRGIYKEKAKRGINGIPNKVIALKDKMLEQAKMFGRKALNMAKVLADNYLDNKEGNKNVLQEYQATLEAIHKEFSDRADYILTNKVKLENMQQESEEKEMQLRDEKEQLQETPEYAEHRKKEQILLKEIQKALEQGDLKTAQIKKQEYENLKEQNPVNKYEKQIQEEQQKREEIQYIKGECDRILTLCMEENEKNINKATKDKNTQVVASKQNIFQRAMGSIFHKVRGAKKFVTQVIGEIQEGIYDLNNEFLPEMREKISEQIDKPIEKVKGKMNLLEDKGKNALGKMQPLIERGKDSINKTRQLAGEKIKEQATNIGNVSKELGRNATESIKGMADKAMQMTEDKLKASIEKSKEVNRQRSVAYADIKGQSGTEEGLDR